nr:hypothetical protein BaRGS_004147 [Batillaria attramentaria]
MEELFKPQALYSKKAMRTVFDRLAHASIMRLNAASMDKLYDLMTMAFKYQVSLCLRPKDVLLITLNHMDAMRKYVEGSPAVKQQVDNVYRMLIEDSAQLDPVAKAHLELLSQLVGASVTKNEFRLNLFNNDKEEEEAAVSAIQPIQEAESQVVKIDASKAQKSAELSKIMGEMKVDDAGAQGDSDLLDLMDSAQ